jgi:histone H3/H4
MDRFFSVSSEFRAVLNQSKTKINKSEDKMTRFRTTVTRSTIGGKQVKLTEKPADRLTGSLDGLRKKKRRDGKKWLKEIRKYQNETRLLMPKSAIKRLVREILALHGMERMEGSALLAIHEAVEAYVVHKMEDGFLCAIHAKRVTIQPKDLDLVKRIQGD